MKQRVPYYVPYNEMNQQIHEVMLSLQRLSQVVLPEMKRVSNVILASASEAGIEQAPAIDALIRDAHRIAGAAVRALAHVLKEDQNDDSAVVQTQKVCMRSLQGVR